MRAYPSSCPPQAQKVEVVAHSRDATVIHHHIASDKTKSLGIGVTSNIFSFNSTNSGPETQSDESSGLIGQYQLQKSNQQQQYYQTVNNQQSASQSLSQTKNSNQTNSKTLTQAQQQNQCQGQQQSSSSSLPIKLLGQQNLTNCQQQQKYQSCQSQSNTKTSQQCNTNSNSKSSNPCEPSLQSGLTARTTSPPVRRIQCGLNENLGQGQRLNTVLKPPDPSTSSGQTYLVTDSRFNATNSTLGPGLSVLQQDNQMDFYDNDKIEKQKVDDYQKKCQARVAATKKKAAQERIEAEREAVAITVTQTATVTQAASSSSTTAATVSALEDPATQSSQTQSQSQTATSSTSSSSSSSSDKFQNKDPQDSQDTNSKTQTIITDQLGSNVNETPTASIINPVAQFKMATGLGSSSSSSSSSQPGPGDRGKDDVSSTNGKTGSESSQGQSQSSNTTTTVTNNHNNTANNKSQCNDSIQVTGRRSQFQNNINSHGYNDYPNSFQGAHGGGGGGQGGNGSIGANSNGKHNGTSSRYSNNSTVNVQQHRRTASATANSSTPSSTSSIQCNGPQYNQPGHHTTRSPGTTTSSNGTKSFNQSPQLHLNTSSTMTMSNETAEQTVARLQAQKSVEEKRRQILRIQEEQKRLQIEQVRNS